MFGFRTINLRHVIWCVISILFAQAVGLLSALLSGDIGAVTSSLSVPALFPPQWLFPVVWTILFTLNGIAIFLVLSRRAPGQEQALLSYAVSVLLNFLWPILFFRFSLYWVSVFVLIALIFTVWTAAHRFKPINGTASLLLIPYFIWLIFALYLNVSIAILN